MRLMSRPCYLSLYIYIHMSQYILQQLGAITALIISSLHFLSLKKYLQASTILGFVMRPRGKGFLPKTWCCMMSVADEISTW